MMNRTDLRPTRNNRPFPSFSRPFLQGFFSVDRDRQYQSTLSNLKYLNVPERVNFNLNLGDATYVEKPASAADEKLTHLLTFLLKHTKIITTKQIAPDFVCFRGLLRMLMSTPYEKRQPWIVLATKFRGTIYLCAEETQQQKNEKLRCSERDKKFTRYGFKFESFVLSDHPSMLPPGSTRPVIEPEEFCGMFSSEIDGKKILYGAEMDGVITSQPCESLEELRKLPMVEVKVKRRETNERQMVNFYKFKSCKWWLQSFLVGIDSIHVGMRNDDGIVDEVKRIPIRELSEEAKRKNYWHGTVAMNFLNDFLKEIATDMRQIDNPRLVYRYQWDSSRSDCVTREHLEGSRHTFLTPQFIKEVEELQF